MDCSLTKVPLSLDFIEKDGLKIKATECKWTDEKVVFKNFLKEYPDSEVGVVTVDTLILDM
jgi:nicotinic acid phosphoribosyltransferase